VNRRSFLERRFRAANKLALRKAVIDDDRDSESAAAESKPFSKGSLSSKSKNSLLTLVLTADDSAR
jgi:hypothetical protein